ncbi:hypothetical protein [Saccharopolyspora shandongensis]|uniref:hypothetical protein n=1 Tax=Saccharopolyspora shandongensis TaxID=418495 RepID=UPI0033F86EAE
MIVHSSLRPFTRELRDSASPPNAINSPSFENAVRNRTGTNMASIPADFPANNGRMNKPIDQRSIINVFAVQRVVQRIIWTLPTGPLRRFDDNIVPHF